jgi:hypothetical protein
MARMLLPPVSLFPRLRPVPPIDSSSLNKTCRLYSILVHLKSCSSVSPIENVCRSVASVVSTSFAFVIYDFIMHTSRPLVSVKVICMEKLMF